MKLPIWIYIMKNQNPEAPVYSISTSRAKHYFQDYDEYYTEVEIPDDFFEVKNSGAKKP